MQFPEHILRGPLRSGDDTLGHSPNLPDRKASNQRTFNYLQEMFQKIQKLDLFSREDDGEIIQFDIPIEHKVLESITLAKRPQTSKNPELYELYLIFKSPQDYTDLIKNDPQHSPNIYLWAQDDDGQERIMNLWIVVFSLSADGNCTLDVNYDEPLSDTDEENIKILTQAGRISATPPEKDTQTDSDVFFYALMADALATASKQHPELPRY